MNEAYLLNDVCELIVDCEHKTAPTQETGYPSIRTPNIGRGNLILDKVKRVSEETYTKWTKRAIPKTDDLILAREAPVGNVAIIPKNLKVCLGQRTVLIRPNKNKIHPHYLCYLLLGDEVQGKIFSLSNGATVHHLNMGDIRNLELPELPSLPVQNKIASIISAYDDLIENNTRRIKILESMAQTLYQEWFVKFRFPGHEQVKMVESELGLIPEGWESTILGDLYKTSSGGTPSRKVNEYYENGNINWVKTRELKDNFIFETEEQITELGLNKSSAKLFPHNTVLIAMYGATIGKLAILANPSTTNQACCAILSQTDLFSYSYIFSYLLENREKIFSLGMGAAQQNISQQVIKKFQILKPTNEIMKAFNEVANPILETIKVLQQKNDNLRKTRDLLLPKLISGQIDVENLDIDTGELEQH